MSDIEALSDSRAAADYFITAANHIAEDAGTRRLRYHLLRLGASAGLTDHDIEEPGELGRLVFQGGRTTDQTDKIVNRADASPLAVTVATVVQEGTSRWGRSQSRTAGCRTGCLHITQRTEGCLGPQS